MPINPTHTLPRTHICPLVPCASSSEQLRLPSVIPIPFFVALFAPVSYVAARDLRRKKIMRIPTELRSDHQCVRISISSQPKLPRISIKHPLHTDVTGWQPLPLPGTANESDQPLPRILCPPARRIVAADRHRGHCNRQTVAGALRRFPRLGRRAV
ncbi:hypothetical protein FB45DRAFT_373123 [Roridomyces roridus]|uniref:Uncharacterized protein n=1 Tax=Roridomyces roridus TaxID=1738132 RepID=A0AAD7FBE3_9AGAR|nr:hypothetical protein FB45DRAFT_373123 [Roridomyces roridus]